MTTKTHLPFSNLLYVFTVPNTKAPAPARDRPKVIANPEITPFEEGGRLCGNCGKILSLDERLGVMEGNIFRVFGYRCATCGSSWVNPSYQEPRRTHPRGINSKYRPRPPAMRYPPLSVFNWKDLPVSHSRLAGRGAE